jgi:leucyl-tRNA synthetase
MDTFVDSSWYFLRYPRLDPERAFDPEAVAKWMPVDQYTGGIEHAILHLLYSRFFTKVLFDLGYVTFTEPFLRLLNQGSVVYAGAAMSKSRGNIVEPMPLVERLGADTVRVTMLFAGPFEDDVDWAFVSTDGVHRWLRRVWRVVHEAASREGDDPEALRRFTHGTIKTVGELYERFRFNRVVSSLMELTNQIEPALERGEPAREACTVLLQMLAPVAPFISEDLWREALGHPKSVHVSRWPSFDEALAHEDRVTLVVQVDGKIRDRIEVSADLDERQAEEIALGSARVQRALDGRSVQRVIARPPRLVNLVSSPE